MTTRAQAYERQPVATRWDQTGEVGGRSSESSGSMRKHASPGRHFSLGGFNPDGAPSISKQVQRFTTIKLSNQVARPRRSSASTSTWPDGRRRRHAVRAYESRRSPTFPFTRASGMQMARGNRFMSFQYGFWTGTTAHGASDTSRPAIS